MDASHASLAAQLLGMAVMTGTILFKIGSVDGKREAVEQDHQRQLDRLVAESATKVNADLMMTAFQEEVGTLVKTVDARMKSVEEMVGRRFGAVESQVAELRQVFLRQPGNGGG